MRKRTENYRYDALGLPGVVLAGVTVGHCTNCGDRTVSIPDMEGLLRLLAATVASKPYALTGKEIRFLRTWLGWSGNTFAKRLHSNPSTVSRWAAGKQPMSAGSELALRLYVLHSAKASYESLRDFDPNVVPLGQTRVRPTRKGWVLDQAA